MPETYCTRSKAHTLPPFLRLDVHTPISAITHARVLRLPHFRRLQQEGGKGEHANATQRRRGANLSKEKILAGTSDYLRPEGSQ